MFENVPYYQVNREERHYCFLLGSEIINNKEFTKTFFQLINSRYSLNLDPESFEIYFEVAALRDYWSNLGDSKEYSDETHKKRLSVLKTIFQDMGLNFENYIEKDVFWTGIPHKSKLWSPGRWSKEKIKKLNQGNSLLKIRWCFNAKPDFLILSNTELLIIEAKLESSEGSNNDGYNQYEIQEEIVHLMQLLTPYFKNYKPVFLNLELNPKKGIAWNEIAEIVKAVPISQEFVKKSFLELIKRYA